jgi:hypothetical protein
LEPQITIDTEKQSIEDGVEEIMTRLNEHDLLDERLDTEYSFSITREEEQDIAESLKNLGHLTE